MNSSARPHISIITITYNAADTLPPTLQSVAGQTYDDYEHIIVDGASKDGTPEMARSFPNPRVRVVSEPDKGLYDAMNKGLRLARGQFILFLNAGDSFSAPDILAKYASLADDNADIIYSDTMLVDSARREVAPRHLSAPARLTFRSFSKGMLVCHQAFMMRRELAPEYDTRYRFSADYDWTVRCLRKTSANRCRQVPGYSIHYLTDGLTDHNKKASLMERFKIMRRHYGFVTATIKHLTFIPRLLIRHLTK